MMDAYDEEEILRSAAENKFTLKEKYERIAEKYVKVFCKKHDLQKGDWAADDVGSIIDLSDYYFNFDDIRYFVDNNIDWKIIVSWYDFTLENKKFIKISAYVKLYTDFEFKKGFGFTLENFYKYLKKL